MNFLISYIIGIQNTFEIAIDWCNDCSDSCSDHRTVYSPHKHSIIDSFIIPNSCTRRKDCAAKAPYLVHTNSQYCFLMYRAYARRTAQFPYRMDAWSRLMFFAHHRNTINTSVSLCRPRILVLSRNKHNQYVRIISGNSNVQSGSKTRPPCFTACNLTSIDQIGTKN